MRESSRSEAQTVTGSGDFSAVAEKDVFSSKKLVSPEQNRLNSPGYSVSKIRINEASVENPEKKMSLGVSSAGMYNTLNTVKLSGIQETVDDQTLFDVYSELLEDDPYYYQHVIDSYTESLRAEEIDAAAQEKLDAAGIVERRAPLNPLKLHKQKGVQDPALNNNPLRGRLIALFTTTGILFFLFLQALILNRSKYGATLAPTDQNSLFGPRVETLFELGGLSTNAIRNEGDTYRLFWAAWMHSGWLHILFNILCQLQFFFMYEPDWGFWRCIIVFWLSGLSGNLLSSTADPCTLTVGSSGGLFGLMGAMIPYCIEYWNTIPRPGITLLFSVVVLIISIIIGFTQNTDNWAHMGGLLGGVLAGLGSITTLAAFEGKCAGKKSKQQKEESIIATSEIQKKKKIHRTKITRQFQTKVQPKCKCGAREWIVRMVSIVSLIIFLIVTFILLLSAYNYQPIGHVSFSESSNCVCCYQNQRGEPLTTSGLKWMCFRSNSEFSGWTLTWGDFCALPFNQLAQTAKNFPTIDALGRVVPTPTA